MTTYYSTAVTAGNMPDYAKAGVVLCRSAAYKPSAALATGAVIQMLPVPAGAKILDISLKTVANGTAGKISIGDANSSARFFAATAITNALKTSLTTSYGAAAGMNYTYSSADTIDVTVTAGKWATANTITMNVFYKMLGTLSDENS